MPGFDASALGVVCAVREESPSMCHALVMLSVADACSVNYSAPSIRRSGTPVPASSAVGLKGACLVFRILAHLLEPRRVTPCDHSAAKVNKINIRHKLDK